MLYFYENPFELDMAQLGTRGGRVKRLKRGQSRTGALKLFRSWDPFCDVKFIRDPPHNQITTRVS